MALMRLMPMPMIEWASISFVTFPGLGLAWCVWTIGLSDYRTIGTHRPSRARGEDIITRPSRGDIDRHR